MGDSNVRAADRASLQARFADSTWSKVARRAALVCVASYLGARLDLWAQFPEIGTAAVFAPYAVVTVALVLSRPRNWVFYLTAASVGCVTAHLGHGTPLTFMLMAEAANHLRALAAAVALRRCPRPGQFDSLRTAGGFLLACVILGPSLGAVVGATAVVVHGFGGFGLAWAQWMLSNALTGLTLLPLLFLAVRMIARPPRFSRVQLVEAGILTAGLVTVSIWVFDVGNGTMLAALYLPLPFLLWAAVRFGPSATCASLTWTSCFVIWGALSGHGPFLTHGPTNNLLELQLFLIALVTPMLLLAGAMQEARHATESLRAKREHYRSIVEDQTELIARFRPDGTCTFANRAYARYFERSETELVGEDLRELDPTLTSRLARPMTPDAPRATCETSIPGPGGALRFQQWRDRALFDASGDVVEYQTVGRDVTEEVRAEEGRSELDEQMRVSLALREEGRRKDDFLAILGHELRNPLTPLALAPELLRGIATEDARVDRVRDVVTRQVRQLSRLVNDLLDVSRITRGKIEIQSEAVDLAAVADQAIEATRPTFDARGHELSTSLSGPIWVMGDQARLCQVATNLLHNAAKYTPRGGQIEIHARREGDAAVLVVRDNGVGITAEMLKRVFELFAQADSVRDGGRAGGLGIGLTIVKSLVELHGGVVEAESAGPGLGAEVRVTIPALPADFDPLRARPVSSRPPAAAPRRLRILVVDDNVAAADMLASLLEPQHDVHVAYDGATGLMKAEELEPELVLLDIAMPKIDGIGLARRLRKRRGSAPLLVAISGFGNEEDRQRSAEAGFDYHLVKPLDPAALSRLVDEAARRAAKNLASRAARLARTQPELVGARRSGTDS